MNMNNISKIYEHEQNLKKSCKQIQIAQMSFICHIHNYTKYNEERMCSWGFGALLKGLTSVVDNSCQSRDSKPQPQVTSPTLYPVGIRKS